MCHGMAAAHDRTTAPFDVGHHVGFAAMGEPHPMGMMADSLNCWPLFRRWG